MTSNLGAEAKISGSRATGAAAANGAAGSRALITASAGGSGGVAAASSVSRGGVGSGGGNAISGSGLSTGQVQSAVAASVKESARPLTKGAGPSRTDEEIQIVFDRYKSALYRIYNRELRNNPSLRGKMVLELVIEPDGSVSACRVKSSDLDSPTLGQKIVMRVKMFNFGPKEGVPQTKILYPIDFLPAG
nr:AgmX/PglI C-terminal domain-containing protein [Alcanivorax sp. DP30]